MSDLLTSKTKLDHLVDGIIRDVCELPDYNSPDDQPELLQATCSQLEAILRNRLGDETSGQPDFQVLLREMWTFWGRPREQEFIDAGISVAKGMDLYERVSAALGDPLCAKCDRRFSQHKTVISHDFTHRPAVEPACDHVWIGGESGERVRCRRCDAEKASALPFERACDRCGKVIKMRQPVTSTVYYCSIECAE